MEKEHIFLVNDLKNILQDAENYEFHDFKNDAYGAPKIALVEKLQTVINNVKEGKYDN